MGAGHPHSHGSGVEDHRKILWIAFGTTTAVLIAQAIGAVWTGSLALLTDTAHMFTDSLGLGVALIAATLVHRPATAQRTWGYRRLEVLAALGQAAVLLSVGVYVAVDGLRRLMTPPEVPAMELLIFGAIGLVGNLIALTVLMSKRKSTFNLRAAFLEVVNDALGSVGVIIAAIVIATTGWQRADSIAGLVIAALIVPRAVILLRDTGNVLLEATPPGLDLEKVREHMLGVDHVLEVHDLHASTVATGLPVISAHVVVADGCFEDGHAPQILAALKKCVEGHFEVPVEHSTFQLETKTLSGQEKHLHA